MKTITRWLKYYERKQKKQNNRALKNISTCATLFDALDIIEGFLKTLSGE